MEFKKKIIFFTFQEYWKHSEAFKMHMKIWEFESEKIRKMSNKLYLYEWAFI